MTGNVGRPGTGLHPLRGQNNVQGASDAGLIPMVYPDYQPVDDPAVREKFEEAWGVALDPKPGLTVVEITHGACDGRSAACTSWARTPSCRDPNSNKVRKALANLDFLVVQDIFLTETAEFADVILPATTYMEKDGHVHEHRPPRAGRPPGAAACRARRGSTGRSSATSSTAHRLPDGLRRRRGDLRRSSRALDATPTRA